MHSDNQQYLLTMRLFGLFIRCPFREATKDCPFLDIRNLRSLELKFQLAEQMASHPSCQENVRTTHEACYQERMRQVVNACQGKAAASPTRRAKLPVYHQAAVGGL